MISVWRYVLSRVLAFTHNISSRPMAMSPWELPAEEERAFRVGILVALQVPVLIALAICDAVAGHHSHAAAFAGVSALLGALAWVQVRNAALLEQAYHSFKDAVDSAPRGPTPGCQCADPTDRKPGSGPSS